MSLTIPLDNQQWPQLRVVTRPRWVADSTNPHISGPGVWNVWPVNNDTGARNGMFVIGFDRCCLPMIGRAQFGFHFGKIDGQIIGVSHDTAESQMGGAPYNPDTDGTTLPDLNGHEVRIQAAPQSAAGSTPAWRTVWWGYVDSTQDIGWPGASVPSGDRIYNCVDGLYRTSKWALDRHGYAATDGTTTLMSAPLRGHPGYNVGTSHEARTAANKWSGGDQWTPDAGGAIAEGKCYYHAQPGSDSAALWTDQEVLEHALAATRRPGEPLFVLRFTPGTANSLLATGTCWPVREGDTVWDLLVKVMRRERGKGVAFIDWEDDASLPTGPLSIRIEVMPQVFGNITYPDPITGSTIQITGSQGTAAAIADVDLINDHRNVAEMFSLGDKDQFTLDALETVGEFIQVLATVGFTDGPTGASPDVEGLSLKRGWSATDQTTFRGKTAVQRAEERFRPVYNLYQLPLTWNFIAGNGNGGDLFRCDYRCAGGDSFSTLVTGSIIANTQFASGATIEATSLLLVDILSDLPLYESFKYVSSVPVRWDGVAEHTDQPRRPILALMKVAADKFVKVEEVAPGMSMRIDGRGIWFFDSAGLGDGTRKISDPSLASLGALAIIGKYENLCFTVGLQLPHRVRLYSGRNPDDPNCRRKAQICVPDHHLWLAHPGAIWELDASTGTAATGHTPLRKAAAALPGTPGLLRDDRAALARQHYLAWSWYGTDRRTAAWALRACGFLPSFDAYSGLGIPTNGASTNVVTYPTLGKTVNTLKANGETLTINTPITRISYDNRTGTTTWETDWCTLDRER